MILVNTPTIPTREIYKCLGLVQGSSVVGQHIAKDLSASLKQLVGGEIKEYDALLKKARDVALQELTQEAEQLGADAIVNIHFQTAAIMQGASEVMVYGTAVCTKAL